MNKYKIEYIINIYNYKIEKMKLILIYINDTIQFIFLTLKN